jgi:hypothetical protein
MTQDKTMAEQILALVNDRRTVSFAELDREIPGFTGGNCGMTLPDPYDNVVLWQGMTQEGAEALNELLETQAIHKVPVQPLTYLIDGAGLGYPLAQHARAYKKRHWCPVVFNSGPPPKEKGKRANDDPQRS